MTAEETIIERTEGWQRALEARDPAGAAAFLAADYALVVMHAQGSMFVPREEWLRTLPDYDVRDYVVHERAVSARGDVATVFQVVDQTAVVNGADRSGTFVLTDIWVREADVWRVWRRHSAPHTAGLIARV